MKLVVCLLAGSCLTQAGVIDPFSGSADPVPPAAVETPAETAAPVDEPTPAQAAPAAAAPAEEAVESVEMPRPKTDAPQILEAALQPAAQTQAGEALPLLEVFRRAAGQPRQRVARAYWKVALAMAADQFARAEQQDFANEAAWSPPANQRTPEDAALLATAAATAAARTNEARLMLTAAQLELADAMGRSDLKLPLASDRPHVGAYRTKYERIFGVGPAPARLRLIHRTIPLRAAGIDRRAASVRSAEEAWNASLAALGRGQADLVSTLASHEALVRERRQFLDAVRDYNFDIAEYALAVAGEGLNEPTIVSMLIQSAPATTNEPTPAAPPQTITPAAEPTGSEPAATDSVAKVGGQETQRALRPGSPEAAATSSETTATLFQDLVGEPGPKLTQLVAQRLTTAVDAESPTAEPLGLAAFLGRASGVDRPAALAAYWRLAEQTARRRVFARQLALLQSLQTSASLADDPAGKARLASEIISLEADLSDADVQLENAQAEANRVLKGGADSKPVLTTTRPHAGRYQTRLGVQPANISANRQVRRAAILIEAIHPALVGHATAIVATEHARAVEAQAVGQSSGQLETALDTARQERLKLLALLQRLTDYNLAIGEYVVAVLPANTPADQLAKSLVLAP